MRIALNAEAQLETHIKRGPIQSRPAFDARTHELDLASRDAWSRYADCAWGPMPNE